MDVTKDSAPGFWKKRYTLVLMCFAAMVISYLDRVNISIAAISMQEEFGWNEEQKGWVFSSFFAGYLGMQIVGGYLSNRFGGKLVLGTAVIFWSLFTILTPFGAMISLPALLLMRFSLGLGEAALAPSGFTLFSRWIPEAERSRTIALFSSGAILGTVLALVFTGRIIAVYGWESVFYIFGSLGFIWAVFWVWLVHDDPEDHPKISSQELAKIEAGESFKDRPKKIPWLSFFSKPQLWALFITYFATSWCLYVFLSWLPSYFTKAHNLDVTGAGLYSLLPWITMFVMIIAAGWFADFLIGRKVALGTVRKLMQSIGLFVPAAMMLLMRDVGSPGHAMILMCAALGCLAFAYSGSAPNVLDLAPRYSDILYGVANTFGTLAGFLSGIAAGAIIQRTGSYDAVFLVTAIIQIVGGLAFLFFGSAKRILD
ncbi:MAG: ACS family MFS transporter [Henriciella sp.]|nr:ACS family MFS transporter [Henriciella sp.]